MHKSSAPTRRIIAAIDSLRYSVNGNPRFVLTFTDGSSAQTVSDAAIGYEIGNPGYRAGDTVDVTFTRAGRIAYMNATNQTGS